MIFFDYNNPRRTATSEKRSNRVCITRKGTALNGGSYTAKDLLNLNLAVSDNIPKAALNVLEDLQKKNSNIFTIRKVKPGTTIASLCTGPAYDAAETTNGKAKKHQRTAVNKAAAATTKSTTKKVEKSIVKAATKKAMKAMKLMKAKKN